METMTQTGARKAAMAAGAHTIAQDFAALRRPVAVFATAFAFAALVVGVTDWMHRQQLASLADATRIHGAALYKLQNTERERRDINLYQPRFLTLREQGMVGQENRLAWIDTIRQSQSIRRLLSVSYEIEPQQPVTMAVPMALGDYHLRASRMHLHLGLLHEMDLFNLLDDLRAAGLYTVQDCRIKRLEVAPDAAVAPRLTSDCTLAWITLGPAPAPPAPAATSGIPAAAAAGGPPP